MNDLRVAAQQALDALENSSPDNARPECVFLDKHQEAIAALRSALEQPEQEPVAWIQPDHLQKARQAPFLCRVEPTQRCADFVPFYTHPPRREWQSLTDTEIGMLYVTWDATPGVSMADFARAIEQALRSRNT